MIFLFLRSLALGSPFNNKRRSNKYFISGQFGTNTVEIPNELTTSLTFEANTFVIFLNFSKDVKTYIISNKIMFENFQFADCRAIYFETRGSLQFQNTNSQQTSFTYCSFNINSSKINIMKNINIFTGNGKSTIYSFSEPYVSIFLPLLNHNASALIYDSKRVKYMYDFSGKSMQATNSSKPTVIIASSNNSEPFSYSIQDENETVLHYSISRESQMYKAYSVNGQKGVFDIITKEKVEIPFDSQKQEKIIIAAAVGSVSVVIICIVVIILFMKRRQNKIKLNSTPILQKDTNYEAPKEETFTNPY
ncbi:hypothetical protein TVAG_078930 [Trichomonas vaginalis G3]|uniref:Transmembrane protein n=1 Tax=Trichomonas vaginalis (strain ATCC PRA-98 / G3) TaxID=412133 RepID=A2FUG0_TRIV3|nr:hypothetical protein TVAGG3_0720460 [Trichomonas vaginalis G3]EAX91455.1 hypothetical protein TVAG_078930 [Trichomonas vaginalis G3]KAI5510554.1 hypothetical protein TVAGG3_0720460 [Trichomonas vaginalis G3]|eukprot:XP_001304385.1 hypothetical protein [Trichomonas vaginalis G3]